MANTSKQAMDPTEAALSAIQEALNVRDNDLSPTPAKSEPSQSAPELTAPVANDERFDRNYRPDNQPGLFDDEIETLDQTSRRPANDDRESVGQILRSLQRRPGPGPYLAATVLSVIWAGAGVGLALLYRGQMQATFTSTEPLMWVAFLGAILVPIAFFFILAHMSYRSQELRLITQAMAEVAIRLSEPETSVQDSIVTVSQAIRREVAAMGDGVERALARAAELEAMVSNEVAALERAYNDNELRVRGLLQDLGTQRETLVVHAEQLRQAITGVHVDLGQDISSISDMINERLDDTTQRIAVTLADKGEHITRALGHAGDSMIEALSERGDDLLQRLQTTSVETSGAITSAADQVAHTFEIRAGDLLHRLQTTGQ